MIHGSLSSGLSNKKAHVLPRGQLQGLHSSVIREPKANKYFLELSKSLVNYCFVRKLLKVVSKIEEYKETFH